MASIAKGPKFFDGQAPENQGPISPEESRRVIEEALGGPALVNEANVIQLTTKSAETEEPFDPLEGLEKDEGLQLRRTWNELSPLVKRVSIVAGVVAVAALVGGRNDIILGQTMNRWTHKLEGLVSKDTGNNQGAGFSGPQGQKVNFG